MRIWCSFLVLAGATLSSMSASAVESRDLIQRFGLVEAATPVSAHPGWRKPRRIVVGGMAYGLDRSLQEQFPEVEFISSDSAEFAHKAAEADAVLGVCSRDLLAAGKSIRWIQTLNAGVEDCVAVPAVRERNILLTNMQRVTGPVMAEHTIGMLLVLTRGLDSSLAAQSDGRWGGRPARPRIAISGKTMLVVGLGGIGTEVAQRAHALGMRVIATRNSGRTGPEFVSYVGLPNELHTLAAQADVIVNTAPLTRETTDLFDAAFFSKMQRTAYFINVARGGSVVTSALVDALSSQRIAGAALDVTDPEPLPADHALWRAPNLLITPHVSNDSDLGMEARLEVLRENVRRYIAGEKMLSVVDVSRGY